MLVYLNLSEGYKGGGFPGDIAFPPYPAGQPASAYLPSYSSETLYAYELGFKSTLADGAVILDSSIFTTTGAICRPRPRSPTGRPRT